MKPEDQERRGRVAWTTLKGDIEAFGTQDSVLKGMPTNPLVDNWFSEARMSLRPLYEKVRELRAGRARCWGLGSWQDKV